MNFRAGRLSKRERAMTKRIAPATDMRPTASITSRRARKRSRAERRAHLRIRSNRKPFYWVPMCPTKQLATVPAALQRMRLFSVA